MPDRCQRNHCFIHLLAAWSQRLLSKMNYCVPVHCDVELIVFIVRGLIAIAESQESSSWLL